MPTPPWLRSVLIGVGTVGVKALREGLREGAAEALDSVLEDVEGVAAEVTRRVRKGRAEVRQAAAKKRAAPRPAPVKQEPASVVDAEIVEEE